MTALWSWSRRWKPSSSITSTAGSRAWTSSGVCDTKVAIAEQQSVMEKLVSLAKRRGFFFQSSEIYGGIQGIWDFGPLGVTLRNNIKQAGWRGMAELRDDVVGLDAGIILTRQTWGA